MCCSGNNKNFFAGFELVMCGIVFLPMTTNQFQQFLPARQFGSFFSF
jgi:hypothetical protein